MSFEHENDRASYSEYYLPKVKIKSYNFKIISKNIFNQPIDNNTIAYENIRKFPAGQGDDYTIGCLLDCP